MEPQLDENSSTGGFPCHVSPVWSADTPWLSEVLATIGVLEGHAQRRLYDEGAADVAVLHDLVYQLQSPSPACRDAMVPVLNTLAGIFDRLGSVSPSGEDGAGETSGEEALWRNGKVA